ncbi:hypothetical protein JVU11DRAFT_10789 [Chiua virens]|nr:hypothetical protein JVU11DRAFT_10789 [Chiua virens]
MQCTSSPTPSTSTAKALIQPAENPLEARTPFPVMKSFPSIVNPTVTVPPPAPILPVVPVSPPAPISHAVTILPLATTPLVTMSPPATMTFTVVTPMPATIPPSIKPQYPSSHPKPTLVTKKVNMTVTVVDADGTMDLFDCQGKLRPLSTVPAVVPDHQDSATSPLANLIAVKEGQLQLPGSASEVMGPIIPLLVTATSHNALPSLEEQEHLSPCVDVLLHTTAQASGATPPTSNFVPYPYQYLPHPAPMHALAGRLMVVGVPLPNNVPAVPVALWNGRHSNYNGNRTQPADGWYGPGGPFYDQYPLHWGPYGEPHTFPMSNPQHPGVFTKNLPCNTAGCYYGGHISILSLARMLPAQNMIEELQQAQDGPQMVNELEGN